MASILKTINSKTQIFLFHILGWIAFGIFYFMPVITLLQDSHMPHHRHNRGAHLWEVSPELFLEHSVFHFVTILIVFYVNYLIFLPQFLSTKRILSYLASLLLIVGCIVFLDYLFIAYMKQSIGAEIKEFRRFPFIGYAVSLLLSMAISISVKMIWVWFENEKQKTLMRNQQLSTELALLKSQVNPHFIFNSLNNIRSLVRKKSEHSETAILKLSDMMRYMLHEAEKDKVLIEKELGYVNDFIALQKLRMADGIEVEVKENIDNLNIVLSPMLLLPLIENAFKHGISYRNPSFVKVNIEIKDLVLTLQVENTIHPSNDLDNEASGLGLSNLKRRLEILYPEKHTLKVETKDNLFHSLLIIQLNHDNLPAD